MINIESLPIEIQDRVRQDIERFGETTTAHLLYLAPIGRMIEELQPTDNDVVWLTTAFHIVNSYASQDPTPIHFTLSREYLNKKNITDDHAVHMLASELVRQCQRLNQFISDPFSKESDHQPALLFQDEKGFLVPARDAMPGFICERDECNVLDLLLAKFLRSIGIRGTEAAEHIEKTAKESFKPYRESNYDAIHRPAAWYLWITTQPNPSIFIQAIDLLMEVIWIDICQQQWERKTRQVPAIARGILITAIKPPLSKGVDIQTTENSITCYSADGKLVATVPCIDPTLLPLLRKGMEGLSSLTGHKVLRWQVRTGFNNWAKGEADPRLISCAGGYEGIARQISCGNGKNYPTDVKAILHAQAHGHFQFPQGGTGNMIILREEERLRNGEPSQIVIVLGDMLLPNFTHRLPKGEQRRLVPITELPPLIGSPNTHAAQAMLQLLILEEFSNQSDVLAQQRCIHLTRQKWEELSAQARLPKSRLTSVIIGWTNDNLFSKAFLDKQGDEYTLGPSYANVLDFLQYQGNERIIGAKGGVKSAEAKKDRAKRGYRRPKRIDKS